jgi:cytoskeletal protein CcmA (bactofilin family)
MWNREESRNASQDMAQPTAAPAARERQPNQAKETRLANIGSSVFIKGELTASEDLTVDGQVEGRIDLPDHALTIGPNANIQAHIAAKVVTVFGSVVGGIAARDKVDIRRGGSLEGDLVCTRLTIQEGAHFCGKVSMGARRAKHNVTAAENATPALVAVG